MKRLLKYALPAIIVGLLIAGGTYAVTAFRSEQVGNSPANGRILQTNGSVSTWVDPSSLGISGGSASSTVITVCAEGCDYTATTTDAQVGINQAIAAASAIAISNKAAVYVKGTGTTSPYTISDSIQLKSNVMLLGDGIDLTVIKAEDSYATSTNSCGFSDGRIMVTTDSTATTSNVTVKGFTFDANVQNIAGLVNNTHARTVCIPKSDNFTFAENKLTNTIHWSVYFGNFNQLRVLDNVILGGFSSTYLNNDGIVARNGTYFWIERNYVDTNAGGGTSSDDAIAVGADSNGTADTEHGVIADNYLSSGRQSGIKLILEENNLRNIHVKGNHVWKARVAGIILEKFDDLSELAYNILFEGNTVENFGSSAGSADTGMGVVASGHTVQVFEGLGIKDNYICNSTSSTARGVRVDANGTSLAVSGNEICNITGPNMIELGATSKPITLYSVDRNLVDGTNAATNSSGIKVFNGTQGVIADNVYTGTTTGTSYGINLTGDDTSTYQNVTGNYISNVDNGVAEVNGGANPDNNNFGQNHFNTVTTKYTILGSDSGYTHQDGANFGVGTSTPSSQLSVQGNIYATGNITCGGTCGGGAGGTASGTAGSLQFSDGSSGFDANELLSWDNANQRLGVGTSTPSRALVVSGATNQSPATDILANGNANVGLRVSGTNGASPTGGAGVGLYSRMLPDGAGDRLGFFLMGYSDLTNDRNAAGVFGYASEAWTAGSIQGSYLTFETTGDGSASRTEKLRMTSDGRLLVGTTTPSSFVHIQSYATSTPILTVASSSGTSLFNIGANGRIGVGNTNPSVTFDVTGTHVSGLGMARFRGSSNAGYLTIDTTTSGLAGFLLNLAGVKKGQLEVDTTGLKVYNSVADAVNPKIFLTNAGDVTFVGTSGNVGIATTTPDVPLVVVGSSTITSLATANCDVKATTNGALFCGTDATGEAGGGITSLNGQTGTTQVFATSTSGGLDLLITSSGDTHTFTLQPATGYNVPLTASTTNWNTFYDTPSDRITAGTGLSWSGNTINLDNDFGSAIDPSDLASADFGDFTCNGTSCTLDATYLTTIGSGATGFGARWNGTNALAQGKLIDNGTVLGVNATSSTVTFNIQGNAGNISPLVVASSSGTTLLSVAANGTTTITSLGSGVVKATTGALFIGVVDISSETNLAAGRSLTLNSDTVDVDSELYTFTKSFAVSASSGTIAATTTIAQMSFPFAVTITRVWCSTDTGTATIQADERAEATPNTAGTDVLSSPIACDNNTEATTSFGNAGIAADVPVNFDIDSVASSPTRVRVHVKYTIDD